MIRPKQIVYRQEQELVGLFISTSINSGGIFKVWSKFMPQRHELKSENSKKYSIKIFDQSLSYSDFTPDTIFTQWACMEPGLDFILKGDWETFTLEEGLYAQFEHIGTNETFRNTLDQIMGEWLPISEYEYDDRPQFEIMDSDYLGPENPRSREEIWIPIRLA